MQTPTEVELFVLQRCWFSGPHHEPSVDCRRLFSSRREAEAYALNSAHDYANRILSENNNSSTRHHVNASVRTILLPCSQGKTSSRAFQTCGKLFWVRAVKAAIIPTPGVPFPTNQFPFASAEVVFTCGVIGGTGNPNSARGKEISEGRIFVSMDPSQANRCAVEVARQLSYAVAHNPHVQITCFGIPIGPAHANLVQDWPTAPQRGSHFPPAQVAVEPMAIMADPSNKRDWEMEMDARAHEDQPSKRLCSGAYRQEQACGMMF